MSFDQNYPNRKDHRKPYRRSARFDRSCRPHGNCGWCYENRTIQEKRERDRLDLDILFSERDLEKDADEEKI